MEPTTAANEGSGAAPPAGPAPAEGRRTVREALAAVVAAVLAITAVKTLPIPQVGALLVLILVAAGAILLDGRPLARHGIRWPPERRGSHALTLLALPAGGILAYGASQGAAFFATGGWLVPLDDLRLNLLPYFIGLHAVWAGLPEELLFRGWIQTKVRAAVGGGLGAGMRRGLAIAIVALLYFAVHVQFLDVRSLLGVGVLGLLLGWLREWTGSLIAPFACHIAYNAILAWIQVSHA